MQVLRPDARLADLVLLDVLDMSLDGGYALNAAFVAACRAAYAAHPRDFDSIVPDMILARAMARGYSSGIDVDALTLAALEIGAGVEADA